jgi:xanthine dehydrogenase iron-sulfur cluster and FAD-binding subunit A
MEQAMVDYQGAQCGFRTPGFVLSLFALQDQVLQDQVLQDQVLRATAARHRRDGSGCLCGSQASKILTRRARRKRTEITEQKIQRFAPLSGQASREAPKSLLLRDLRALPSSPPC